MEKEKKEAKRREKLLEQNRKVTKMLDPYVSRLIAPARQLKPKSGLEIAGQMKSSSKRNLSESLSAKARDSKRQKMNTYPERWSLKVLHIAVRFQEELSCRAPHNQKVKLDGAARATNDSGASPNTPVTIPVGIDSLSESNMELLLHAAGLEVVYYSGMQWYLQ